MHWQLLDTGVRHAAWNMAIDEALLQLAEFEKTPVLRFYGWEAPTLSLGYFQSVNEVDLDECERLEFDWVRRPTGGRAVLHDRELTYSFVGPIELLADSVEKSYEILSEALALGLGELGLPAELTQRRPDSRAEKNPVCFVAPAYAELTIQGKKVIGSAQMRTKRAVLQHGSIPLSLNYEKLVRVFRLKQSEDTLRLLHEKSAGLEEFLNSTRSLEELKHAIQTGFERRFESKFKSISLREPVAELACKLFAEKYSTRAWNFLR